MRPIQITNAHYVAIIAVLCLWAVTQFGKWMERPGGPIEHTMKAVRQHGTTVR